MLDRADLLRALSLAGEIRDRADDALLPYIRWLPGQDRFLRCAAPRKLYRAGNQALGKTTAGLTEVHWTASGEHPHLKRSNPPNESWILCQSWSQSVAIMAKFWSLVPKHHFADETQFDPIRGFRGRHPAARYRNGSIVRFKTSAQGAGNLAGATIDGMILIDEPTHARLYEELNKRVLKSGGTISICMTPVNGPVAWCREMCEAGLIEDIHTPLTPEALIPVGSSSPLCLDDLKRTPMDAAFIAELRRNTLPMEEPVVIDGEWETRCATRLFTAWDSTTMVSEVLPTGKVEVCVGIDYGAANRAFAQTAILVAVQMYTDAGRRYPRVYVLDERSSDGSTSALQAARDIVAMLKANGMAWRQVDRAYGDKPVASRWVQKSNVTTMQHLARLTGKTYNALAPRILKAKSGKGNVSGSVSMGCRFLHQAMVRGDFYVNPKCERLIQGIETWDYTTQHPTKDIIDALRYSLKGYVFGSMNTAPRPVLRIAS